MRLRQSKVVFNEQDHTYFLGEQQLSGITSIIRKYICPSKYDGVDPLTLERARERGTIIHSQLEELFLFNEILSENIREEVKAFQELAKEKNLQQAAAEYLVDNHSEGIATKIDTIYRVCDNVVDLGDYKCTCNLDKTYLSWQLSIGAYLFELNNPGIYVRNLYGIHLKGDKARCVDIKRIPDFAIKQLLLTYQLGLDTFDNPMNY